MTKLGLLKELEQYNRLDAQEMAFRLGVTYSAAAMGLLRLVRQGLVARYRDPESDLYWYELTAKGEARLDYLDVSKWGDDDA